MFNITIGTLGGGGGRRTVVICRRDANDYEASDDVAKCDTMEAQFDSRHASSHYSALSINILRQSARAAVTVNVTML